MTIPDAAVPTRISSINESKVGQKLRVAGRLLSYDPITCLVLLYDQDHALLVDVSLSLDGWVRETKGVIMIIGDLEHSDTELQIPLLPPYASAPGTLEPYIVLRAILVIQVLDLDLGLWNRAIEERETSEEYLNIG